MTTKIRPFKLYKKEEYAYKNTSCIESIFVPKDKNTIRMKNILMCINGIMIEPSHADNTGWYWEFEQIRENIREMFGETKRETELLALEATFTYNALKAIQHYKLTREQLKNSIFTSGLMVQFVPSTPVDILEANETVYISDQQQKQKQEQEQEQETN
jgi:hypothetical protein